MEVGGAMTCDVIRMQCFNKGGDSTVCVCVYQAKLRLQLDLQCLQSSLQVSDLAARCFDALGAHLHLLVQLIELCEENRVVKG